MRSIQIRFGLLTPILFAGLLLAETDGLAREPGPSEIRTIAAELIQGLDSAKLSAVPTNGAFDEITVKIAAFRAGDGDTQDLGRAVRAVSLQLTSEMQARYGDRYRFVSAEAQEALLAELAGETAGGPATGQAAVELAARSKPDILIRPVILTMSGGTYLTYQAIGVFGAEILATSKPVALEREPADAVLVADFRPAGSDGVYRPIALEAERLLRDRGYDPGAVDGYIDDDLRRALRDYQTNSALWPSGRLTWETVENLRRDRRRPQ